MRVQPASSTLFARNRDRLRALLPAGSLVVVHSNDVMPTNADGTITEWRVNMRINFIVD